MYVSIERNWIMEKMNEKKIDTISKLWCDFLKLSQEKI